MVKRKKRLVIKHHYSGGASNDFWEKIKRIKDKSDWQEMYSLGVALQNLEEFVLKQLKHAL